MVLGQIIVLCLVVSSPPVDALDSKDQERAIKQIGYNADAEREVSERITDARIRNGARPLLWVTVSCWNVDKGGLQFVLYEDNWAVYRSEQSPTGFMKMHVSESVKKSLVALTQKTAYITPKKSYRLSNATDQPGWRFFSWLNRASMRPKEFEVYGEVDGSSPAATPEKLPESVLALHKAIVAFREKSAQPWVPSDAEIELKPKVYSATATRLAPKWPDGLPFTSRKLDERIILRPDYSKPNKILDLYKLLDPRARAAQVLVLNGRTYEASWIRFQKTMTPEQAKKELEYSGDPSQNYTQKY
jgi:hypothetical protein